MKLWVIAVNVLTTAQAAIHPDMKRDGRTLVISISRSHQPFSIDISDIGECINLKEFDPERIQRTKGKYRFDIGPL